MSPVTLVQFSYPQFRHFGSIIIAFLASGLGGQRPSGFPKRRRKERKWLDNGNTIRQLFSRARPRSFHRDSFQTHGSRWNTRTAVLFSHSVWSCVLGAYENETRQQDGPTKEEQAERRRKVYQNTRRRRAQIRLLLEPGEKSASSVAAI